MSSVIVFYIVLGFNYFMSVWRRWARVWSALPSSHYDDDDEFLRSRSAPSPVITYQRLGPSQWSK